MEAFNDYSMILAFALALSILIPLGTSFSSFSAKSQLYHIVRNVRIYAIKIS
jgi:hypothetical protein